MTHRTNLARILALSDEYGEREGAGLQARRLAPLFAAAWGTLPTESRGSLWTSPRFVEAVQLMLAPDATEDDARDWLEGTA